MVKPGPKKGARYTFKKWKYFFMNEKLHRTLVINLPHDEVVAWDYEAHKKVVFAISAVKRYGHPAMRMSQAAKILNRSVRALRWYIAEGMLPPPAQSYSLTTGNPGPFFYSKKDINRALQVIGEQHRGRPRKDGLITNRTTPTPGEVRAATEYGMKLYAKTDDGKVVRVWEADKTEW